MSKPIDTDAVRARYSSGFTYADTPGEIRALADEIDRLRAENEHARHLAERYLCERSSAEMDAGRLSADVAAMLPIVEAVAEVCTESAYMYRNGTPYQVLPRELCEAARRFLDARKVGP